MSTEEDETIDLYGEGSCRGQEGIETDGLAAVATPNRNSRQKTEERTEKDGRIQKITAK